MHETSSCVQLLLGQVIAWCRIVGNAASHSIDTSDGPTTVRIYDCHNSAPHLFQGRPTLSTGMPHISNSGAPLSGRGRQRRRCKRADTHICLLLDLVPEALLCSDGRHKAGSADCWAKGGECRDASEACAHSARGHGHTCLLSVYLWSWWSSLVSLCLGKGNEYTKRAEAPARTQLPAPSDYLPSKQPAILPHIFVSLLSPTFPLISHRLFQIVECFMLCAGLLQLQKRPLPHVVEANIYTPSSEAVLSSQAPR